MVPIKGICVSVQFGDLLSLTLHKNARHLTDCLVVTHPDDKETQAVVSRVPSARCFCTDVFYRGGARFNKGWGMELGLDVLGRDGWIAIWDADTLFPDAIVLPPGGLDPETLYTAPRRILDDPRQYREGMDWKRLPLSRDMSFAGYFQLFSASASVLAGGGYFYDPTFQHAGGCDGYFESRWPANRKVRLPFEVLHLGPRDANWFGRTTARVDGEPVPEAEERAKTMLAFKRQKGWLPGQPLAERIPDHVEVPGHQPSGYQLRGRK
jgi:hypothetical protein